MRLFGTDGLRGQAGDFPLDPRSLRRIGEFIGRRSEGRTVVVGGDTRESTPQVIAELAAGLASAGSTIASAGTIPTPGVAELVLALGASTGISVSASHNPWRDNGIKIFGSDGRKWPDPWEQELEESLLAAHGADGKTRAGTDNADTEAGRGDCPQPPADDPKLAEIYLQCLSERVGARLEGFSVLIDAGNGAAYRFGAAAFERAGARAVSIHAAPNGHNINDDCGALHPAGMAEATRARGVSMGVAYDGDADRAIFADENGRVLDGDDVLWIVATHWKRTGTPRPGGVVGTVMSNYGLEAALEREGIPFARAAVGDRNVARLMAERGADLGGETSGHILIGDAPTGDGIATSLLIAKIVVQRKEPLSRLATLPKVPQSLRNVRVRQRRPLEEIARIANAVRRAEESLDHRGRVYLRYSGTEPLLRILVEGFDAGAVERIAEELETAVRAELA